MSHRCKHPVDDGSLQTSVRPINAGDTTHAASSYVLCKPVDLLASLPGWVLAEAASSSLYVMLLLRAAA